MHGIGIAGIKKFAGGFGHRALGAWGEPVTKQFVQEAVNEAPKLEASLAGIRTPQSVAFLHYPPIEQTVEGEPLEIYPFVGSSRREEPLTPNDPSPPTLANIAAVKRPGLAPPCYLCVRAPSVRINATPSALRTTSPTISPNGER